MIVSALAHGQCAEKTQLTFVFSLFLLDKRQFTCVFRSSKGTVKTESGYSIGIVFSKTAKQQKLSNL